MGAGYSQSYDGLPLLNDNFGGSGNPLVTAAVSIKGSSSMRTAQDVELDPRNPTDQFSLDPGGLVTVASVAKNSQPQDPATKLEFDC